MLMQWVHHLPFQIFKTVWTQCNDHFTNQLGRLAQLDAGCNEVIDYDMFKEKAEKVLDQASGFFVLTLMQYIVQRTWQQNWNKLLVQEY
jgi:hypothetical protein